MEHKYSHLTTPINIHTHSFSQQAEGVPIFQTLNIDKEGIYTLPNYADSPIASTDDIESVSTGNCAF